MPYLPDNLHSTTFSYNRDAALASQRLVGYPHLSERELAARWRLSVRTLQRWRVAGSGPTFLRLGRRITYRLSDVELFETAHSHVGDHP